MLTAAEKLKRDVLMRNLYKTNKAVKLKIAGKIFYTQVHIIKLIGSLFI